MDKNMFSVSEISSVIQARLQHKNKTAIPFLLDYFFILFYHKKHIFLFPARDFPIFFSGVSFDVPPLHTLTNNELQKNENKKTSHKIEKNEIPNNPLSEQNNKEIINLIGEVLQALYQQEHMELWKKIQFLRITDASKFENINYWIDYISENTNDNLQPNANDVQINDVQININHNLQVERTNHSVEFSQNLRLTFYAYATFLSTYDDAPAPLLWSSWIKHFAPLAKKNNAYIKEKKALTQRANSQKKNSENKPHKKEDTEKKYKQEEDFEKHIATAYTAYLRDFIRYHQDLYYKENKPQLADSHFDFLFAQLNRLEQQYPHTKTPNSPTLHVGADTQNRADTPHATPMLSLQNTYSRADIEAWYLRMSSALETENCTCLIEPKYDGVSVSLTYENGQLVRALTRGDGVKGEDITANVREIASIPQVINMHEVGVKRMEIRGEILLLHKDFESYNALCEKQGRAPATNARNLAAGSIRLKNPTETKARKLTAFLYHISSVALEKTDTKNPFPTQESAMKYLSLFFQTSIKHYKITHSLEEIYAFIDLMDTQRNVLPFAIDGLVIKINDIAKQHALGTTSHHPRWAVAYKFKAEQAVAQLLEIIFQVGRTGAITPVAKIKPTPLAGVTISSISLFNEQIIADKDIRVGDFLRIERAGEVIPYVHSVVLEKRSEAVKKVVFPTYCPRCQTPLMRTENEVALRCPNYFCPAQVVERLIHFTSKDAMDIQSLGEQNVRRFYALGYLQSPLDIYRLPYELLEKLDGLGKKSVDNLRSAIEASKTNNSDCLLFALGIRFVGKTIAKTIASRVDHLLDLCNYSQEDLQHIEDVGPKVAESIYQFFHDENQVTLLKNLEKEGLQLHYISVQNKNANTPQPFAGKTFLLTGTLESMTRTQASEQITKRGGVMSAGVNQKLNYLIVGDKAGSKLEKARQIPSIQVIDEPAFLALLKETQ